MSIPKNLSIKSLERDYLEAMASAKEASKLWGWHAPKLDEYFIHGKPFSGDVVHTIIQRLFKASRRIVEVASWLEDDKYRVPFVSINSEQSARDVSLASIEVIDYVSAYGKIVPADILEAARKSLVKESE